MTALEWIEGRPGGARLDARRRSNRSGMERGVM